ncbi:MAG: 2-C-methyl-D-erythritol 4-phosphate cytidylyltransferase [Salinivirgaceae bacterium]|nr:2-C-methyl-D-erythritol 4-phosphate cytidylyltransferase [Salinivirgaceae bacterium]
MNRSVIIVAGGSGSRMGGDVPKQFMPLAGRPILMHTIEAFHKFDNQMNIVLVLPAGQHDYWRKLCTEYSFNKIDYQLVDGGATRFHSTLSGLAKVPADGIVAVHDGVRPLVSQATLQRCFTAAEDSKAVVPAIPVNESVRQIEHDGGNHAVDRSNYELVQTPQVFDAQTLHGAFAQPYDPLFTDDASVVERMGVKVSIVEGNFENIKITRPVDLILAEAILLNSKR